MVFARGDSGAIILGGRRYLLAQGSAERPAVTVATEKAGPGDTAPFEEVVPFGAVVGMGSSLPAVAGQYDYSLNVWVEDWDELAPGYDLARLTDQTGTELALDNPIVAMETAADASGNRYLYAGEGGNLHKFRLTAIGGNAALRRVAAAKAFSHGSSTTISDVIRLKEGSIVQYDRSGIAYTSDGYLLVGFGETAQIQQVNTIGVDTVADTYGALNASAAYGGVFGKALGASNTQALVFKSTGVANQNSGAFSCIQTALIQHATGQDYTRSTASTPWGTLYQVGEFDTSITAIIPWGRSAVVVKPEGIFTFDSNYNADQPFSITTYRHPDNGRSAFAWGKEIVYPTAYGDLKLFPPRGDRTAAGITALLSVLGPHRGLGNITAATAYGDDLFWTVYDGTDSYLMKARRRDAVNVPHPLLVYPVMKLAGIKCRKLLATTDGASTGGKVYLFFHTASTTTNKHSIGYIILDPPASRTFETGGEWYSTRMGDPSRRTVIEEITTYGVNCDSDDYWELSLAWDEGAAAVITGTAATSRVTATGAAAFKPVAGTGDNGYLYQVKAACTLSASSQRPRLRGMSSTRGGPGGFIVTGVRQAEAVDVLTLTLVAAKDGMAGAQGRIEQLAHEQYDTLKALIGGGTTTLVLPDHFGDQTARRVTVQAVAYTAGFKDGGAERPERLITVTVRVPRNTT